MILFDKKDIIDNSVIDTGVTFSKIDESLRVTLEIVENLDEESLNELLSGSGDDIDKLLRNLVTECYASMYGTTGNDASSTMGSFNTSSVYYMEKLSETVEKVLRTESLTYFLISVLPEFELNWHHIEWAEAVQYYKYSCFLAARDHGKSYFFSNAYLAWKLYRYSKHSKRKELSILGKEGYLFSFSKTQAIRLLRTLKETIEETPILHDMLYPGKDGWADTKILCKNGSRIIVESAGASTRGAHPGFIVVDDFLKDNVLYSEEQRTKYTSYFHSVIMNMIQPGGYVTVVGTPFHAQDLYGDLKSKKKVWHVREYPSIFPDGRILWSNRYSFENLMEKKESQGSINFSREHLVRPITNDSSIFPFNILERSLIGMQHYTMVHNIESFPKKLTRVGIGVDLAISSNIGADYTVFTVGGLDEEENVWILKVVRLHGKSYGEQIAVLKKLNTDFRPNIIQVESNAFQMMFAQAAEKEGMPIMEAPTTAKSKNDMKTGLPGLALLFEKGKLKIPVGDQYSKDMKDMMFAEFSSITWTSQGLRSASDHDDMVMSMHQLIRGLDYRQTGFGFMLM